MTKRTKKAGIVGKYGLADENESVCDAALGAGHVLVEHYAATFSPNWNDGIKSPEANIPQLLPQAVIYISHGCESFEKGLISGSAALREQAALGLGELIEVAGEQSLKEVVIPITEPLIRIIGDHFPWQVKSAILSTLTIMIRKGGISLKPFLPQLQTTFVKCLQDNTSML
ncbi:eIF-2-alpha kinase activator GCN1 [Trifolium repens]|nr:eIF-2-alpha kinase activator GCN1 [Trifolium repens]